MMESRSFMIVVCGLAIASWTAPADAAAAGMETFDDDEAGWVQNTTAAIVSRVAVGGNPGGYLQAERDLEGPSFDIGAAVHAQEGTIFTGDYAAAGIHEVTVDLVFMTGPPVAAISNFADAGVRFRYDGSHNGWLFPLTDEFPLNQWNTYSTGLFDPTWSDNEALAAGWLQDGGMNKTFAETMAHVDIAEVRLRSPYDESSVAGIDNFTLIPEPATVAMMVLGGLVMLRRKL